ncbi:methionine ABC transporter ATP-binding protein [Bifidobacterium scaligerum]|uniref:Methionine ABC transporter ATP-binding protein n=1 Tax=Bifidobacterium scaligerum TaxID=2052656 RepID=A0A2M9HPM3_9BIFI|nr:ATP-binding cassette domain-containing protein [Bifidobacterium scaligerum]PJM78760.1 methionine ABC transporter ATP-binding protein [Bifidobacterium scaligerum]
MSETIKENTSQDAASEPFVRIEKLSKTYRTKQGEKTALHDVDLSISKGDIYGIIGLSGAGKSTLVRCINGLERYDGGSLTVNGREVKDLTGEQLRGLRRKIGMIFQSFNLIESKTVGANVELPLLDSGLDKNARSKRVRELLSLVDLEDRVDSYPGELSGGQKQRVAIARALANNPDILLSDEATSALDPNTTRAILALLRRLRDKFGLTIIIITHEMSVIREVCNRVAVIDHGTIVEHGDVFDLFANPQAELTKSFVDTTSNLGKVRRLIEAHSPLVEPKPGQRLIRMKYVSKEVSDALVSDISTRFGVRVNIVFGDIDVVANAPIGGLVVIFDGASDQIDAAIAYLRERNISVEVLLPAPENR